MEPVRVYDQHTGEYVEMGLRELKVQEVIDAVTQDGFEWLRGQWYTTFDGKLSGGCVLGQGALNLNVVPNGQDPLGRFFISHYDVPTIEGKKPYLIEQLDRFKVTRKKWLPPEFEEAVCGQTIVFWNDHKKPIFIIAKCHFHPEGHRVQGGTRYALKTYKAVAKMVAEILYPYRNKTITLLNRDYSGFTAPKEMVQNA